LIKDPRQERVGDPIRGKAGVEVQLEKEDKIDQRRVGVEIQMRKGIGNDQRLVKVEIQTRKGISKDQHRVEEDRRHRSRRAISSQ